MDGSFQRTFPVAPSLAETGSTFRLLVPLNFSFSLPLSPGHPAYSSVQNASEPRWRLNKTSRCMFSTHLRFVSSNSKTFSIWTVWIWNPSKTPTSWNQKNIISRFFPLFSWCFGIEGCRELALKNQNGTKLPVLAFAYFHGISIPTITRFKLTMVCDNQLGRFLRPELPTAGGSMAGSEDTGPQTWADLAFVLIFPTWQLGSPGQATEPEFLHMNWGENDQPRATVRTRQGGIGQRSQTPVLWGPSRWHGDHSRLAGTRANT